MHLTFLKHIILGSKCRLTEDQDLPPLVRRALNKSLAGGEKLDLSKSHELPETDMTRHLKVKFKFEEKKYHIWETTTQVWTALGEREMQCPDPKPFEEKAFMEIGKEGTTCNLEVYEFTCPPTALFFFFYYL